MINSNIYRILRQIFLVISVDIQSHNLRKSKMTGVIHCQSIQSEHSPTLRNYVLQQPFWHLLVDKQRFDLSAQTLFTS